MNSTSTEGNVIDFSGGETITLGSAKKYFDLCLPSLMFTKLSPVKLSSGSWNNPRELETEINHRRQTLVENPHLY